MVFMNVLLRRLQLRTNPDAKRQRLGAYSARTANVLIPTRSSELPKLTPSWSKDLLGMLTFLAIVMVMH